MPSITLRLASISSAFITSLLLTATACMAAASIPPGWEVKGDQHERFDIGIDPQVTHDGKPSAFIGSQDDTLKGLATLKQKISAEKYIGKRIRFSGWLKTENVKDGAVLWMRVDNTEHKTLQMDNMEKRLLKGSNDWKQYSIVLDVPPEADSIHFGFLISESGKVWASDLHLECVSKSVPSTNMLAEIKKLASEPVNLDFSKKR